ncbi:MAG: FAD-dependent oxidoreductase [Verrucomicrobia bacterium]|nr:FAD-dependent oxidoreductase [Verrucomicrobiota bacterium]
MKKYLQTGLLILSTSACTVSYSEDLKRNNIGKQLKADVCVYGASGAGINAAVAVAREGFSVVIVEPTRTIGGMMATGFRMQQDAPSGTHLGGLTLGYYLRDLDIVDIRHGQGAAKENMAIMQSMIDDYSKLITVITNHRLASVNKSSNGVISEAMFEFAPADKNGVPIPMKASDYLTEVRAKVFIDASYEGDLMAFSGVAYRVGKESRKAYGESLAGIVVTERFPGVDPYVEKGNPRSGLLSCIPTDPLGKEGDSSRFFNGYNFKLAFEMSPSEKYPGIPIAAPDKKNGDIYELLKRYTEAGYSLGWPSENWSGLMSAGMQVDYPDGDWTARSRIWQGYVDLIKTLCDFTGKKVRFLSNQNEETNGWPDHLYTRSGRRMVGEYVMTQKDIQLQTEAPTPVGLGYYCVDIYANRLVVLDDGTLAREGSMFALVSPGPYQIPYGAIIPKKDECKNLLVSVCMSASHVAYASVRMEATYMVMGEATGVAAALAVKTNKAVQDIDRKALTLLLKKYGQKVKWDGKGFRRFRFNVLNPRSYIGGKMSIRWETNPEEYSSCPIDVLWK